MANREHQGTTSSHTAAAGAEAKLHEAAAKAEDAVHQGVESATEGAHGVIDAAKGAVDHATDSAHGAVEHTAAATHGAAEGHHELHLGRHLNHPPEPPQLIQLLFEGEQEALKSEYDAAHPGSGDPGHIEKWLKMNEKGEWEQVEGQKPTLLQTLHVGNLTKDVPLLGYGPWENHVFLGVAMLFVVLFFAWLTAPFRSNKRQMLRAPGRRQMAVELIVGFFDDFCEGVLGKENGRRYMPYIATLFCVILTSNLMGLVPLMKAPTSSLIITFSLAMCTFIVVQGTAWVRLGPANYIHHLLGSPKDGIGWALCPLFLLLEVISDFVAKPMSLSLRLFGNILGKDILLGAFLGMGISLVAVVSPEASHYIGVPLTIPFYFLGLLLSTIQALVFSLLTCIYITMVLPHDHDHEHGHDHNDEHAPDHGDAAHHDHRNAVHERVPA